MGIGRICILLLLVAVPFSPVLGGDRDVAELFYEKGEKARRGKRYEEAVGYYQRALGEVDSYPEAAFQLGLCLEKLGKTQDAIQAYLTCQDQLAALEKLNRTQKRLGERARKAIKKLGQGYADLAEMDAEFVKKCMVFGRKYISSYPKWAKKAFESVFAIMPSHKTVGDYLERLAKVGATADGLGTYDPLIIDDKLSNWTAKAGPQFKCKGGLLTCSVSSGKANFVKAEAKGTYSFTGKFRMLEKRGDRTSYGLMFGYLGTGETWALLYAWDNSLGIVRFAGGENEDVENQFLPNFDRTKWHTFRIDVTPGVVTSYIDGEKSLTHNAETRDAFDGQIGVFVQGGDFEVKDLGVKR